MGRTPVGEDSSWISSSESFRMTVDAFGNPKEAERRLNRHLRMGKLRARAQACLTQPDHGPMPRKLPSRALPGYTMQSPAARLGIVLGPAFWKNSGRSIWEPKLWKWASGVFAQVSMANSIVIKQAPESKDWTQNVNERHVYFGVAFLKYEIESLIASAAKQKARPANPKKRAQQSTLNYKWDLILAPFIAEVEAGIFEKKYGSFELRGTRKAISSAREP